MFLVEPKGDSYLWRILSYVFHNFGEKDIVYNLYAPFVDISSYILFEKSYCMFSLCEMEDFLNPCWSLRLKLKFVCNCVGSKHQPHV